MGQGWRVWVNVFVGDNWAMGLKKKKLWRCFRPDSENIAPRFNNHRKLFRIGAKRACINKAREDGRRIKPTDRRCCLKGFWFDYFALPFLVAGGLRVVPRVVPQAGFALGEPSCPPAYIHNGDARASRHAHVAPCKGLCALQHQKNSGLVGLLSRLHEHTPKRQFFPLGASSARPKLVHDRMCQTRWHVCVVPPFMFTEAVSCSIPARSRRLPDSWQPTSGPSPWRRPART